MPEESKEPKKAPSEPNEPQDIKKILERIDSEQEKRKAAEAELKEVANDLKGQVPEEYQDLIPDLPPRRLIKWLQNATSKGLFDPKPNDSLDSKKPGGKSPTNFDNMTPQQIMETGYKTK